MLNGKVTRDQAERLYRLAYLMDSSFFKPADAINFGIDVRRLKECGEVRMTKPIDRIRAHAVALWLRMTKEQKAAFFMSCLLEDLESITSVVGDLEKQIGNLRDVQEALQDVREALTWINLTLFGKFPKHVMQRLETALRKWKISGLQAKP